MSRNNERHYASPILIYDNFCRSCTRFAQVSRILSRNRIYVVGHYTNEGQQVKSNIFPVDFDANTMFWMVTRKGAFGARSGLLPLISEVIKGLFGIGEKAIVRTETQTQLNLLCSIDNMSCTSMPGFFSRLSGLLRNSKKIERSK
jgi:hypothetical protein